MQRKQGTGKKAYKAEVGRLSELYGVVQETQGTGRSVKYVIHFSEAAVLKAFSSRNLTHQTTDEAKVVVMFPFHLPFQLKQLLPQ